MLSAFMALIFDLHQLIDMMSIGTLLAYTIVAICVLVLRYEDEDMPVYEAKIGYPQLFKQSFKCHRGDEPSRLSSAVTKFGIVIFSILAIVFCSIIKVVDVDTEEPTGIILLSIFGALMVLVIVIIVLQPASTVELTFKVPLVPFIPCLSVLINLYLMFQLDFNTWIRFLVWIVIGYAIYFVYGIRYSEEGAVQKRKLIAPSNGKEFEASGIVNNGFVKSNSDVLVDKL